MRRKIGLPVLALTAMVIMSGCVGNRTINYLKDKSLSKGSAKLFENRKFEYRLQTNDVLSIRVMGLDQETHGYFNVEGRDGFMPMSDAGLYVNGFSVNKDGKIQMPTVGYIKVQGLTIDEAQVLVQRKVNEFFTTATVILKLVSFKVSVLGAVEQPGAYYVYSNQINILEALAMAGGVGEFADKGELTLIRQSDRGVQALKMDLSTSDILSSEYYYLLPNDVVYVPALKARSGRLNLEMIAVLFAAISAGALLYSVTRPPAN